MAYWLLLDEEQGLPSLDSVIKQMSTVDLKMLVEIFQQMKIQDWVVNLSCFSSGHCQEVDEVDAQEALEMMGCQ